MRVEYQDGGEESRLLITSWFFDWREHNRLVDEGFFRRTTVISGATAWVMCAEVTVEESGYEVRRVDQ
ncbi:hypothetical protein GVC62_005192 [Salmonella enterica]|nr:hypothetical protein [Salmonella enterica]